MRIFSGNANRPLAQSICQSLDMRLGEMTCSRFADGEVKVQVHEDVRGADVFIIQPTHTNDFLMELLVIADAMRRASVGRITAVIPYFGYARQDRKHDGRVPITAKLVANLLATAGIDRVLAVDLHATQIQGFFDIPLDHLSAFPVQLEYLKSCNFENPVLLSPDTGSIKLADKVAKVLGADLAIIDKRRTSDTETEVANVIGTVEGREVIIVDDMISTAGTLSKAIQTAYDRGAKSVMSMATHAILCGTAYERLSSTNLDELVITDTIPLKRRFADLPIRVLSLAGLLGDAIHRIHTNQSVSSLIK